MPLGPDQVRLVAADPAVATTTTTNQNGTSNRTTVRERPIVLPPAAPVLVGPSWTVKVEDAADPNSLIPLSGSSIEVSVVLRKTLRIAVEVDLRSPSTSPDPTAARLVAVFVDGAGQRIGRATEPVALRYSPGVKTLVTLNVPAGATRATLTLTRLTRGLDLRMANRIRVRELEAPPRGPRPASDIRIAMIADPFTFNSYKYECNAISVRPDRWREQFEEHAPDLFLCESAWEGTTSDREWRGRVYASTAWPKENRTHLLEILNYCRAKGIPTVFWNKEDPSHYDDRKHDFVKTAILFDHVLTTDEQCVSRYRNEWGVTSVGVLPFAAQPRIYNPAGAPAERDPGVIFAGSWYGYHPKRSQVMTQMLDTLIGSGVAPVIFDRYHGNPDSNHIFPDKYQHLTRAAIPHSELGREYRKFRFGLNFNTETRSTTMFARRVFELMMSGTAVITNYSRGVDRFFGDNVIFLDRDPEALRELEAAQVDQMRERALEQVLAEHTYARRLETILDIAGIRYSKREARFDAAARVQSREDAMRAIGQVRALGATVDRLALLRGMKSYPVRSKSITGLSRPIM